MLPLPSPKRLPAARGFGRRGFAQAGIEWGGVNKQIFTGGG